MAGEVERVDGEEERLTDNYDGRQVEVRPSVAGAVREMRSRSPAVRPKGIFHHPATWEQEELDFVADCLKQNIPIHTIANMVHCERHCLARLIESRSELKQLKEDKYENLLDEAEYQADRLMKAGNAPIVIHVLNTLGRKRGWGVDSNEGDGGEHDSRIVMGIIPAEEVQSAETAVKEAEAAVAGGGGIAASDPMQMALVDEAVKTEVDRRTNVVEAEGTASASPVGNESIVDENTQEEVGGYMAVGGGYSAPSLDDPWAAGADSPFFQ